MTDVYDIARALVIVIAIVATVVALVIAWERRE